MNLKIFIRCLSLATTSIRKRYYSKRRLDHLSDNYKNRVLRERSITLSKWTTDGVYFQNKKETDFANLIKGNISGKKQVMIVIGLVKVTD